MNTTTTNEAPLTSDELAQIGRALYGQSWMSSMARDLKLRDEGRISQMATGKRHIPVGFRAELIELAEQRMAEIEITTAQISHVDIRRLATAR